MGLKTCKHVGRSGFWWKGFLNHRAVGQVAPQRLLFWWNHSDILWHGSKTWVGISNGVKYGRTISCNLSIFFSILITIPVVWKRLSSFRSHFSKSPLALQYLVDDNSDDLLLGSPCVYVGSGEIAAYLGATADLHKICILKSDQIVRCERKQILPMPTQQGKVGNWVLYVEAWFL